MAQPKRAATLARWGTTLVMHAEDRPDCALGTHESYANSADRQLRGWRSKELKGLADLDTYSGGIQSRSSELVL